MTLTARPADPSPHRHESRRAGEAIRKIIPDADFDSLGDNASFRSELELDSLDFLSFVEHLSAATGVRIDEDDYPDLVSMATSVAFLTRSR